MNSGLTAQTSNLTLKKNLEVGNPGMFHWFHKVVSDPGFLHSILGDNFS